VPEASGPSVPPSRRAIAVWGHFASGNLGDELVVGLMADAIRRRRPGQPVVAISSGTGDTERRHGIRAHPLNPGAARAAPGRGNALDNRPGRYSLREVARRVPGLRGARRAGGTVVRVVRELPFLIRSYRLLREIDALVVSGSGQLLDAWRGPWWHPYTTFRWALLARLTGTDMIYPSVGAGPIDHRLSRAMLRKSVDWAAFVSVRDAHSAEVLRAIGVARELPICPDMGWAWKPTYDASGAARASAPVVGVNPMSHEDPRYWPRGDAVRYEQYLVKLAGFVANLIEHGHPVLLFSSQPRADGRVAADLQRLLEQRGIASNPLFDSAVDEIQSVDDLVAAIARCDYVVAGRFHSVLLPLACSIPTVGLAYHPKTCELLGHVGHPERCFDIDRFDVPDLIAAFERLRAEDGADARRALLEHAATLRVAVERQFDVLFGAVVA
jgi:polysaccharide pyruvyl transferase WcaK-like protein